MHRPPGEYLYFEHMEPILDYSCVTKYVLLHVMLLTAYRDHLSYMGKNYHD